MAIVEPGSLVMLDEPTNDVDPVRRRLLWEQVRGLAAGGRGVVLVTHNITEAERAIDRVVVLGHGRVAAAGTPGHPGGRPRDAPGAHRRGRLPAAAWAVAEQRDGDRRTVTVAERDAHLAVAWAQSRTTRFVGAPGLLLGVLVAVLRFDLILRVSWLVVPAMLLVALTGTGVGFAIAYAAPPPVTNMVSQLIVFIALMFSPINFPADRLPEWLRAVHLVLPFESMAQVIRETLTVPPGGVALLPFGVLAVWCAAGLAVTVRVMTGRA